MSDDLTDLEVVRIKYRAVVRFYDHVKMTSKDLSPAERDKNMDDVQGMLDHARKELDQARKDSSDERSRW